MISELEFYCYLIIAGTGYAVGFVVGCHSRPKIEITEDYDDEFEPFSKRGYDAAVIHRRDR